MLNLQPGDIVELSAQTLLNLNREAPELFQRVLADGVSFATVREVGDLEIRVELCGTPVHIRLDQEHPWRTVRLFQRRGDAQPLDEMPPAVEDVSCPELPEPFAAAIARGFPARMPGPFSEPSVPLRVQFAHVIFLQFILIRYKPAMLQEPHVSGDEWKAKDPAEVRVRELDVPEQKLYEAALTTMVRWLGEDSAGRPKE